MNRVAVKTVKMRYYPESEAAKKFVNKNACFEIYVADHAYQRNKERLDEIYQTYRREDENKINFLNRCACEVCVKILNLGIPFNKEGIVTTISNDFIWVFDMTRDIPLLVTMYPYKKFYKKNKEKS